MITFYLFIFFITQIYNFNKKQNLIYIFTFIFKIIEIFSN